MFRMNHLYLKSGRWLDTLCSSCWCMCGETYTFLYFPFSKRLAHILYAVLSKQVFCEANRLFGIRHKEFINGPRMREALFVSSRLYFLMQTIVLVQPRCFLVLVGCSCHRRSAAKPEDSAGYRGQETHRRSKRPQRHTQE